MRRPERLAESLREEIAEIVGFEMEDPRLQSVTVTDVQISENMRDAKVFVLVSGTESNVKDTMKALMNASTFVRQQIAMNLSLRHVPHLHFARDTAEENASRIAGVLSELEQQGEFSEKEIDSSEA